MASSLGSSSRASSSSSSQRRRKLSESRASKEEYNYALPDTSISEWLKCPICLNPFVDPIQAPSCEHVFCKECIHKHMAACREKERQRDPMERDSGEFPCPTCRSSLSSQLLRPAANLIRNMVDSLLVKCPHQRRGCNYTCERSLLSSHAKKDCGWAYIGEYDEEGEGGRGNRGKCDCGKRVLKRDWPTHITGGSCSIERFHCVYAGEGEAGCQEMLREDELKEHQSKCTARPVMCQHCDKKMQQGQREHHEGFCPEAPTTCSMARFGCSWEGRREALEGTHTTQCPFLPLKAYLIQQEGVTQSLRRDNAKLSASLSSLQDEQKRTLALVQKCMASLGPSYLSNTSPSVASETEAEPITASQDVIVPLSTPPSLDHTLSPPSPPVTLRGRSGTTIDIPTTISRWEGTENISTDHASTSAPASRANFPWQWPEPAAYTASSTMNSAPFIQTKTVSDSMIEMDRKLSDMTVQLKRLDRRVEEIHVVGLNANFEASRAHEELNNVHHGLHALRISMIMHQQQRSMPGNNFMPSQGGPLSAEARASDAAILPNTGAPPPNPMPLMGLRRFWTGYEQTKL